MLADRRYCYPLTISDYATRYQLQMFQPEPPRVGAGRSEAPPELSPHLAPLPVDSTERFLLRVFLAPVRYLLRAAPPLRANAGAARIAQISMPE